MIFGLTHNYTGYPMVRQAREMVAAGEVGKVRVVQVEYAQDWLTTPLERTGQKQAEWRTDPARSGPAGCLGESALTPTISPLSSPACNVRSSPPISRSSCRDVGSMTTFTSCCGIARARAACCGRARSRPATRKSTAARIRRGGGARVASGRSQLSGLHAARRAAAPDPPQWRRRETGGRPREPYPGRPSGRLSRGLCPALHRSSRTDRGADRKACSQSGVAASAQYRRRRRRHAFHRGSARNPRGATPLGFRSQSPDRRA